MSEIREKYPLGLLCVFFFFSLEKKCFGEWDLKSSTLK